MSATPTPAEALLNALPAHFVPAQAQGVNAVIGLSLADAPDGEWQIVIRGGQCTVLQQTPDHPNATLRLTAADFVALMDGTLNPFTAVMSGRLKLGGDTALLLGLERWFA